MDQGSVVVLCRRTTHSSFVAIVSINRDLYYSGLYPAVTTSDPRSIGVTELWSRDQWIWDQVEPYFLKRTTFSPLIPDPWDASTYANKPRIRDQLLSCAGGPLILK